jgi:hypothetical protein
VDYYYDFHSNYFKILIAKSRPIVTIVNDLHFFIFYFYVKLILLPILWGKRVRELQGGPLNLFFFFYIPAFTPGKYWLGRDVNMGEKLPTSN